MGFQKGHPQFNSGRTHFKKGMIPFNKKDRLQKICKQCKKNFEVWPSHNRVNHCSKKCADLSLRGKPSWNKGLIGFRSGEKRPGIMPRGEKHWSWKGGPKFWKKDNKRNDSGYQGWVLQCKKRDKQCQLKDENCDGYLVAHHIKPWRNNPELRYEINNGITLCQAHHPRKRADEKRLIPIFMGLVSVSNANF